MPDLVTSGKVLNESWQISVRRYAQGLGHVCWFVHGPLFGTSIPTECGKLQTPPETFDGAAPPGVRPAPVQFGNFAQEQVQVALGVVGADVTSLVLRLDDAQELKLIRVRHYGYRLVGFVVPRLVGIASVSALLNSGQYATTIASNAAELAFFGLWVWHGARGRLRGTV